MPVPVVYYVVSSTGERLLGFVRSTVAEKGDGCDGRYNPPVPLGRGRTGRGKGLQDSPV